MWAGSKVVCAGLIRRPSGTGPPLLWVAMLRGGAGRKDAGSPYVDLNVAEIGYGGGVPVGIHDRDRPGRRRQFAESQPVSYASWMKDWACRAPGEADLYG